VWAIIGLSRYAPATDAASKRRWRTDAEAPAAAGSEPCTSDVAGERKQPRYIASKRAGDTLAPWENEMTWTVVSRDAFVTSHQGVR